MYSLFNPGLAVKESRSGSLLLRTDEAIVSNDDAEVEAEADVAAEELHSSEEAEEAMLSPADLNEADAKAVIVRLQHRLRSIDEEVPAYLRVLCRCRQQHRHRHRRRRHLHRSLRWSLKWSLMLE